MSRLAAPTFLLSLGLAARFDAQLANRRWIERKAAETTSLPPSIAAPIVR